jgi:hypothetical protein
MALAAVLVLAILLGAAIWSRLHRQPSDELQPHVISGPASDSVRTGSATAADAPISEAKWKRAHWPSVATREGAKFASRQAFGAAVLCTGLDCIFAALGALKVDLGPDLRFDLWALGDASVFGIIAWGLWRYSRIAAWAGLLMYALDRLYAFSSAAPVNFMVAIILTLAFVNGVRGTMALHRFRESDAPGGAVPA